MLLPSPGFPTHTSHLCLPTDDNQKADSVIRNKSVWILEKKMSFADFMGETGGPAVEKGRADLQGALEYV